MLRMTASDPLFAEWNELLTLYAMAKNPQCHFDLAEAGTPEYAAGVQAMYEDVVERFEELNR